MRTTTWTGTELLWTCCILMVLPSDAQNSLCDMIDYSKSAMRTAKCARNTTCDIQAPRGTSPPCHIQSGEDCRHPTITQGKETGSRLQRFPARISKLGVHSAMDAWGNGQYNFHVKIAVLAEGIQNGDTTGIRMEFKSEDDNNCMHYKMPSCRLVNFSRRRPTQPDGREDEFHVRDELGGKDPPPYTTSPPQLQGAKGDELDYRDRMNKDSSSEDDVYPTVISNVSSWRERRQDNDDVMLISNSCFGLDVQPGLFTLSLTSFPTWDMLVYRISWHNYYDYDDTNSIWSEQVVGVASVPEANEIHVVFQPPIVTFEDSGIRLELWNSTHLVDKTTIPAIQNEATFREVPRGSYRVSVTPVGYPCALSSSCPAFLSDDVFVDTALPFPGKLHETRSDSSFHAGVLVGAVISCAVLFCLAVAIVLYKRRKHKGQSSMPSVLLISLDKGRLQEMVVKYLALSLTDVLRLNTCLASLESTDNIGLKKVFMQEEFVGNKNHNSSWDASSTKLKSNPKFGQIKAVVMVSHLHQSSPSECEAVLDEMVFRENVRAVLQFLPKRLHRKMSLVYFINRSDQLSSVYSSSDRSSDQSVADSDDTVTVLLSGPTGESPQENSTTMSLGNIKLQLGDITHHLPYYLMPLEVLKFFKWMSSFKRNSLQFSNSTIGNVLVNDKWNAAKCCSEKVFIDKDKSNRESPFVCVDEDLFETETIDETTTCDGLSIEDIHVTSPIKGGEKRCGVFVPPWKSISSSGYRTESKDVEVNAIHLIPKSSASTTSVSDFGERDSTVVPPLSFHETQRLVEKLRSDNSGDVISNIPEIVNELIKR